MWRVLKSLRALRSGRNQNRTNRSALLAHNRENQLKMLPNPDAWTYFSVKHIEKDRQKWNTSFLKPHIEPSHLLSSAAVPILKYTSFLQKWPLFRLVERWTSAGSWFKLLLIFWWETLVFPWGIEGRGGWRQLKAKSKIPKKLSAIASIRKTKESLPVLPHRNTIEWSHRPTASFYFRIAQRESRSKDWMSFKGRNPSRRDRSQQEANWQQMPQRDFLWVLGEDSRWMWFFYQNCRRAGPCRCIRR